MGCFLRLVCLIAVTTTIASAQQDDQEQDKSARLQLMIRSVSDVQMSLDDESELMLQKDPLLRWSNPVSGINDGSVFIWTANGRPQAAVQVFRIPDGRWLQEFQSLSTEKITAFRRDKRLWAPSTPGIKMQIAPMAPPPQSTAAARLVQMRSIVRQFKANDLFEDREPYELRFMSSPVYRYGDSQSTVIDGALFVFAHGTDPEVLVLMEATKEEGAATWKIGFAPLTSYAVEVTHNGTSFLSCPHRPPPNKIDDTFLLHILE